MSDEDGESEHGIEVAGAARPAGGEARVALDEIEAALDDVAAALARMV